MIYILIIYTWNSNIANKPQASSKNLLSYCFYLIFLQNSSWISLLLTTTGRLKKKTGPCFISLYLWQFINIWTGNTLMVCCKLSLAYQMIVKALQQTMSELPVHMVINCQRYRLIKHGPVFFFKTPLYCDKRQLWVDRTMPELVELKAEADLIFQML